MNITLIISLLVVFVLGIYQYKKEIKMIFDVNFRGITEISENEIDEVNGGIFMLLLVAFGAGVALYAATHNNSTACYAG
jgi:hypothetical protein